MHAYIEEHKCMELIKKGEKKNETCIKDMNIRQIVIMPIFTTNHNNFILPRWACMAIAGRWLVSWSCSMFPDKGLYKQRGKIKNKYKTQKKNTKEKKVKNDMSFSLSSSRHFQSKRDIKHNSVQLLRCTQGVLKIAYIFLEISLSFFTPLWSNIEIEIKLIKQNLAKVMSNKSLSRCLPVFKIYRSL